MNKPFYLRQKFWLHDFIKGSPIRTIYNYLKKFHKLSFSEANTIREKRLRDLLDFAIQNTEFYSDYKTYNLQDYPVMNKSIYIENYNEIKVDIGKIPGQKGVLHIQTTSGSTGTPFKMPQDTNKRNARIAELKYFGEIVGFKSHEPLVHLRTWNKWQNKTPKQIKNENIIPFDISKMGEPEILELHGIIQKNKTICLRGYASSLDLIAKCYKKHNLKSESIRICIAGSEALQDDARANVKDALQCEIISQYANEECGILAQERIPTTAEDNVMYPNHANYIFECLSFENDDPVGFDKPGRLVITDLTNKAFPIIRYDTGDVAMFGKPDCFSQGFPIIKALFGRRFDICYTTDNKPFTPMSIGRVLKHYEQIKQWQFIQKGQKEYELRLIFASDKREESLEDAIAALKETLGQDAVISIVEVKEIPVLSSGKRKPVINEYQGNGK